MLAAVTARCPSGSACFRPHTHVHAVPFIIWAIDWLAFCCEPAALRCGWEGSGGRLGGRGQAVAGGAVL